MKILVINTGSSTLKYKLFDHEADTAAAWGVAERIGEEEGALTHHFHDREGAEKQHAEERCFADHREAMGRVVELLTDARCGVVGDLSDIAAVGHRVVHGAEAFRKPVLIDETVLKAIRDDIHLAPLHNPSNLAGIETARHYFPDTRHVAVFDTAFHQTLPPHAHLYALPYKYYARHRIRKFGFHGTSHRYVAEQAADMLGMPLVMANLITLHLGSGASITAIERGKSVDTSMGLTPLEGLIMGTRCGDIDPAITFFLERNAGMTYEQIENLLNRESGLKGLCGNNDMRDILSKRASGDALAELAVDMYCYRIKKYIGAYTAVLGKVHAVVFTGGIGENAAPVRELCCAGLEGLGMVLDRDKNASGDTAARAIHADDSTVQILVIPTDEERAIALRTAEVLNGNPE